ncbi:MAG: hypothetical protein J6K28_05900 [Alistipes sp.]|nr:hypothetical protein [Alistipes sp.]
MGKKLKFAIITLLGFSTACSSVKKAEKSTDGKQPQPAEEVAPAIKVMYGVRRPAPETRPVRTVEGSTGAASTVKAEDEKR